MDNTIRVGDLVMVVRPTVCCDSTKELGMIFVAGEFYSGMVFCRCGFRGEIDKAVWVGVGEVRLLSRLRRINPPANEQTHTTERGLVHVR